MAVLVPLLVRGLREKSTTTRRQTAVIIENMSKLVENAQAAAPFLPRLIPALDKAAETVADPEARAVCARALEQLQRLEAKCKELEAAGIATKIEHDKVLASLKASLKLGDVDAAILDYLQPKWMIAKMRSIIRAGPKLQDLSAQIDERQTWIDRYLNYMRKL